MKSLTLLSFSTLRFVQGKFWSLTALAAFLLVACGETTNENITQQITQAGLEVVDSFDDLPECTDDNNAMQVWVVDESSVRVCVKGEWFKTVSESDTVYVKNGGFSCKTEELADKSGLKIICNGDSIGVVLNGAKGEKGDDGAKGDKGDKGDDGAKGDRGNDGEDGTKGDSGAGCSITGKTDTTVTVTCGDSTIVIQLGHAGDGDTTTISLEALVGYTQKGPFLKGSSVYLYELNGSLNQTNGNFTSVIADDDGRYRFRTRGLKYPYAMVVVDGYYRNEVTGVTSDAPIRLRAITDVSSRVTGSANVNLLTHLEFDRVNALATGPGKLKLKEAKHKAQTEILDAFHFDTNLVKNVQSEDMNVFGESDADAALLAVSVLLQGDGKAADLSVLLTELADDLVDGKWDGSNSAARKAELADWALKADFAGVASRLDSLRSNVRGWHLGQKDTVPEFEKFIRKFYGVESHMGVCGSDSGLVNKVKHVSNSLAPTYYASKYSDVSNTKVRFICKENGGVYNWRIATDIEKDTMGLGHEFAKGQVKKGLVNTNLSYVFDGTHWRHGTAADGSINVGCIPDRKDTIAMDSDSIWYKCKSDTSVSYDNDGLTESAWTSAWRPASDIEKDTALWAENYANGTVRKGNVTGLPYVFDGTHWRHGTTADGSINVGCIPDRRDTVAKGSDNNWYKCKTDTTVYYDGSTGLTESAWTSAWRKATNIEKDTALWAENYADGTVRMGNVTGLPYVFEDLHWRHGTVADGYINVGCTMARMDTVAKGSDSIWYKCKGDTSVSYYNGSLKESAWRSAWRKASNIEKDTATWGVDSEGAVRNGQVNTTLTYVFQDDHWRLGTTLDGLLVDAGGEACLNVGDTSTVKYNNVYYVCTENVDGAISGWVEAPEYYNDTYEARTECKAGGLYSDGRIMLGRVNPDNKYVCDAGKFRNPKDDEIGWNRGCVSYIRNQSFVLGDQLSHYKCGGQWLFDIAGSSGTMKDAAETEYRTIAIAYQVWMAENMNYEIDGSSCNFSTADSCAMFGRFYTWDAANQACPDGWHLPTKDEWEELYSAVNKRYWALEATGYSGWPRASDAYGFTALPAGHGGSNGTVVDLGSRALFWTASEGTSAGYMVYWYLNKDAAGTSSMGKSYNISVRCIKDDDVNP